MALERIARGSRLSPDVIFAESRGGPIGLDS
jgi:hypothetical protein